MNKTILLSIIIIAILLISGLFLILQNQNLKKEVDGLRNKIEELEKQKPEPVAEKPPEGWKEYVDEEYKFRIWYPEDIDYSSKGMVLVGKYKERPNSFYNKEFSVINFMKCMPETKEEPIDLLYIYIYIYNSKDNINDFIKNDFEKIIETYTYKDIKAEIQKLTEDQTSENMWSIEYPILYKKNLEQYINSHTVQLKIYDLSFYKLKFGNDLIKYYVKINNQIFVFNNVGYHSFIDLSQIVDQMVHSFKFTD